MIICNGAAPAALALDALYARNGKLATLSEPLLTSLAPLLPKGIGPGNPLDLKDDATPERYLLALSMLLNSHDLDALLIIHAPAL